MSDFEQKVHDLTMLYMERHTDSKAPETLADTYVDVSTRIRKELGEKIRGDSLSAPTIPAFHV